MNVKRVYSFVFIFIMGIFLNFAEAVVSQPKHNVLGFKEWKSEQVIHHQNRVARLSNRLIFLKAQPRADIRPRSREGVRIELSKLLVRAKKDLQIAQELDFQDYLAVYLKGLSSKDISRLAQKLSDREVAELLRHVKRRK